MEKKLGLMDFLYRRTNSVTLSSLSQFGVASLLIIICKETAKAVFLTNGYEVPE
jgi:hypothetical protein